MTRINHHDLKQLGEERVCVILQLHITAPHQSHGKNSVKIQEMRYKKRSQRSAAYWIALHDFLILSKTISPRIAPPVGWFPPLSITNQENLPQTFPGQSSRGIFSAEVHSSKMTLPLLVTYLLLPCYMISKGRSSVTFPLTPCESHSTSQCSFVHSFILSFTKQKLLLIAKQHVVS